MYRSKNMEKTNLKAYAKINIILDITGKRDDGYHLLNTVMQTVDLYDEITLSKRPKGVMVNIDKPFLPDDERNLAFKAAKLVKEQCNLKEGVLIEIKKKIPVGGGMAGGSTDAACVIAGMNRLFDLNMSMKEQEQLALRIGADVPFCLHKGTYQAQGIGEVLTKLTPMPDFSVVICAPPFSVSTAQAYQAYDAAPEKKHPDVAGFLEAAAERSAAKICSAMGNSLEPVVEAYHPQIKTIRKLFDSSGAIRSMMSGSGSVVFGLFEDRRKAEAACEHLKTQIEGADIFLTKFIRE